MLSDVLNPIIDTALESINKAQEPRHYLGGSRVGAECQRQLQFEFFNVPKDAGKDFQGRILRIFDRGHWVESAMVNWMRSAGIQITTEDEGGGQFGFSKHNGLFKGHCDGIIVDGPGVFGPFPRLWENKGLKATKWNAMSKHGVLHESPVYWSQCQIYMNEFGLTENPALFSVVNMDTMEIYWEAIPFNHGAATRLDEKADRILKACLVGELLPMVSKDPTFFQCKWCSWVVHCQQWRQF